MDEVVRGVKNFKFMGESFMSDEVDLHVCINTYICIAIFNSGDRMNDTIDSSVPVVWK